MEKNIFSQQAELRVKLSSVLRQLERSLGQSEFDFIIAHCEINQWHGVGVLLKRIFAESQGILSIRSTNLYDGQQDFGKVNFCLAYGEIPRSEILAKVRQTLGRKTPKRILSVPYYTDDVLSAIAIKDLFGVPLCTYIMDDQNVCLNNIPDQYMGELLAKSDLRLGISRELCAAYEQKYGYKFWFLPPVVEANLIPEAVILPRARELNSKQGILIGNIWSQQWLDKLCQVMKNSGLKITWYGNPNRDWLSFQEQELEESGITFKGFAPEAELIEELRKSAYAIVPTGSTAKDRPELAQYSLPSRIPYIVATAHTPIIVIGRKDTAAAKFVEEYQIGAVCNYDGESFAKAVEYVCSTEIQEKIRKQSAQLAQSLSAEGVENWIWQSLEKGKPCNPRFEKLGKIICDADGIITYNEVNQRHGTGALVKRIFAEDNSAIFSFRTQNHYQGEHNFGDVQLYLPQQGRSRSEVFENVVEALNGSTIKRVFCMPYSAEELLLAIAIKELFGIRLGTYIMDDQNICVHKIPDDLMKEFLSKCSLRLATHPEIRDAYEAKYGFKFWLLPAIVPHKLLNLVPKSPTGKRSQSKIGALVGSVWSEQWFNLLQNTLRGSGAKVDWYGNNQYYWLKDSPEQLKQKGVNCCGLLEEAELAERLQDYAYVVVPTGTLDSRDDHPELSRLSLPGRIIFILATANTPIIILGSRDTSAAHFVERFQIGVVCDYDGESFRQAVDYVTNPTVQLTMRQRAAAIALEFSDKDINKWIWNSLELGYPCALKFEKLLPRSEGDLAVFIEPPVPEDIYKDYIPVYQVMRRLKNRGFQPDFIVDVGASHGIWSYTASKLFTNARFLLIDPLIFKYEKGARDYYLGRIPNVELLQIAVSNEEGKTSFQVSPDLYGSSLLHPADFRSYDTVEVEVKTLDSVAKEKAISGRGILKLDVQCAEHIVLEGASNFLAQVDAIVAELSLVRYAPQALIWSEMIKLLEDLGFRYYDETGGWRSPVDGTLLQKEVLFLRKDLFIPETSQ